MANYLLSQLRLKAFYKSFLLSYKLGNIISPKFVIWDCTRRCNLNCLHCGAKKEKYPRELSTEQVKSLITDLSLMKVQTFSVTGGEPLLRDDIFEISSFARSKGLNTGIATNGFFINKPNSMKIAKIFDSVQISLDGPENIHNKIRGNKQAFGRVIKGIGLLKTNHCRQITISSVFTPVNIDYLEDLGKIIEELKINIWKILTVMPIGKVENNKTMYLDKIQIAKLFKFIGKNKKKLNIEIGENLGFLGNWDKKVRQEPFFCPVGFLACCIGVDGKVRGCPEQPDLPYFREGDILKDKIKTIWDKGFKKYRDRDFLNNVNCQKCSNKEKCLGGCWVMRMGDISCSIERYGLF